MKFVFAFFLMLSMVLGLASLSVALAPESPSTGIADQQPATNVPQEGQATSSAIGIQPASQATSQVTSQPQAAPSSASQQPAAPQFTADGWEVLAPGISYKEFHLDGPVNVYVARMDQSNSNATIDAALANGQVQFSGRAQVSSMAQLYDGAINTWARETNKTQPWGMTNQVVVAINGQYTDAKTGESESGVVTSYWYAKRYNDGWERSGFAWTYNRAAFIGGCVFNSPSEQLVDIKKSRQKIQISGVNRPRGDNELVMYTPQYAASTGTNPGGVEVLVEMSSPTITLTSLREVTGTVQSITENGSTLIPYDSIVLSASGSKADELQSKVAVGDKIGISQEITNFDPSCKTENTADSFNKTYASIGGHFRFLNNGKIQTTTDPGLTNLAPRTAIAYTRDLNTNATQFVYFIVVDGRSKASIGMSMANLASFAQDTLGATDGISEDGGGSSTIVVNGVIRNFPSDCKLIFIPAISNQQEIGKPAPVSTPVNPTTTPAYFSNCERPVPDSIMMVASVPKQTSQRTYTTGTTVTTISDAYIRLGPGTNYASIGIITTGSTGTIQADPNGLNGVWAKGYYWWKISFGDKTGWVAEINLAP